MGILVSKTIPLHQAAPMIRGTLTRGGGCALATYENEISPEVIAAINRYEKKSIDWIDVETAVFDERERHAANQAKSD